MHLRARRDRIEVEGARESRSHAEVASRPDVKTPELMHEKHLRGPWTYTSHCDEMVDDLLIGHSTKAVKFQTAVNDMGGEIEHRCCLGSRESGPTQF